jgi:DNA-binding NarL/FixJ family response regulator
MALSYTQKKEMLASVMGKLDSLSKELEHGERTKVNSLKRSISTNIDDESNWDNFQVHFDQKNNNFFQKLKEIDPKLSESYLLFCSYVRMGKSNKEIAELLNVSVAAVEKRKYRLKKKWELADDTSFTDYLKSL